MNTFAAQSKMAIYSPDRRYLADSKLKVMKKHVGEMGEDSEPDEPDGVAHDSF